MLKQTLSIAMLVLSVVFMSGCSGEVTTTEDSTKLEVEGPKVELGDEAVDLDPTTDDDVDIDTPLDGDS